MFGSHGKIGNSIYVITEHTVLISNMLHENRKNKIAFTEKEHEKLHNSVLTILGEIDKLRHLDQEVKALIEKIF